MSILKIPSIGFRGIYVPFYGPKIKPLRLSVLLCSNKNQLTSREKQSSSFCSFADESPLTFQKMFKHVHYIIKLYNSIIKLYNYSSVEL